MVTKFENKHKVTLYLPKWMVKKLKSLENQSQYIEKLIAKHSGWNKPGNYRLSNEEEL